MIDLARQIKLIEYTMQRPYYFDALIDCSLDKGLLKDDVITFIHPFYPEFRAGIHGSSVLESAFIKTQEYIDYKRVINELINKSLSDYSKALFTFPEDYVLNFSKDLFDSCVLTVFGGGFLINNNDARKFKGKNVLIAGCYVEDCVNEVVDSLIIAGVSKVSVILDGVLFSRKYLEGVKRSNDYLLDRYYSEGFINKMIPVKSDVFFS